MKLGVEAEVNQENSLLRSDLTTFEETSYIGAYMYEQNTIPRLSLHQDLRFTACSI